MKIFTNSQFRRFFLLSGLLVAFYSGNSLGQTSALKKERPVHWAKRLDIPGAPNLHQVSKSLYRGAQPTLAGIQGLKKIGIKTIINLRSSHSDREKLTGSGLMYESIPMKPWAPDDQQVIRFLKIVSDPARPPVFVHCRHGADRTGTVVAIYRIVVQGWTKEQAISEMTAGGYGFHSIWKNLLKYIRQLDIEKIKAKAGLSLK